jgi:hypothetical protein
MPLQVADVTGRAIVTAIFIAVIAAAAAGSALLRAAVLARWVLFRRRLARGTPDGGPSARAGQACADTGRRDRQPGT